MKRKDTLSVGICNGCQLMSQLGWIPETKFIQNNSKLNFQKVFEGKPLKNKNENIDVGLDIKNLFEDIFSFEDVPTDTVRLSASTINQLFKETNYNLDDVRKTKLVKPIKLSLLPGEIGKIESTTKKKNLFIMVKLQRQNLKSPPYDYGSLFW